MYDEGSHIKLAIEEMSESENLSKQNERLLSALNNNDYPVVADMSKAVLETIFKTIINDRISLDEFPDTISKLYKEVNKCLVLSDSQTTCDSFNKIINTTISQIAEIRNKFGTASHGNDGRFNNPLTKTDAIFLQRLTDTLGGFLILRHRETIDPNLAMRLIYADHPEFNDWLDEQYGTIAFPTGNAIPYSLMLSKLDHVAYREMYIQYRDSSTLNEELPESQPHPKTQNEVHPLPNSVHIVSLSLADTLPLVTAELIKIVNKYRHLSSLEGAWKLEFGQDNHWMKVFSDYINRNIVTDWELKDARKAEIRNQFSRLLTKMRIPRDNIPMIATEFIDTLVDLLGTTSAHAKNSELEAT